jgi:alkylation response protein AidB-like acyl-CoA dehydrogenase
MTLVADAGRWRMDFTEGDREAAFRAEARAWIGSHLPHDWQRTAAERLTDPVTVLDTRRWWQRELHAGGWIALTWPKEHGGRDAPLLDQVIFNEELTRAKAPEPINVIGLYMVGPTIIEWGTAEQRKRYLPPLLSGDEIWCQGFSEPDAGSDLAAIRTWAERHEHGYVLNGQKVWTSYSPIARFCMLQARTSRGAKNHDGLTCLIVDLTSPGVTVRPLTQITGNAEFGEIFLSDVHVPADNLLGPEGQGWAVAMTTLAHERGTMPFALQVATRMLFDELVDLSRLTNQAKDPRVRSRLARLQVEVESLRLSNLRALGRLAAGRPGPEEAVRKLLWERADQAIARCAMDLLDADLARGSADWGELHRRWRYHYLRSRARSIEAGTTEILKDMLAVRVLGLPRSR